MNNHIKTHIDEINKTITQLISLNTKITQLSKAPGSRIGIVIRSALVFLTALANSIDKGNRRINFHDFSDWLNTQRDIHRVYFNNLHILTEMTLEEMCTKYNINAESAVAKTYLDKIIRLEKLCDSKDLKDIKKHFKKQQKNIYFNDRLKALLRESSLSSKEKQKWLLFFNVLKIIRDQCSHIDRKITTHEIKTLKSINFPLTNDEDKILLTTNTYSKIAENTIEFLNQLNDSLNNKYNKIES